MTPDLSLAYLAAHLDTIGVAVHHPAALCLLLVVAWFILSSRHHSAPRRLAALLRATAFGLLVLAVAGLRLTARLPNDRLSLIAAVDVSESIDAEGRAWEERYLNEVARALAPGDELGAVAFASDARVIRPPGAPRPIDIGSTGLSETATDIARGLEVAIALLAPDAEHRVLLISDGNETRGDSLATVAQAQRAGAAIYAAVPPHAGGVDVALEKLAVPRLVTEGTVFPIRVVLRNPAKSRSATLSLLIDGQPVGDEGLTLQAGLNAVEIPYRMSGPGSHRIRAQIAAVGDVVPGNNYREATVMVGGKARVLLVTTRARSVLARVLDRKGVSVAAVPPEQFPARVEDLIGYHCVIFEDVAASAFPPRGFEALERYVKDFGGGLVVAAGERTYGDAGFRKTAVERLLPVTLEPRRPPRPGRESLALFLLIDRSNSMGYHITQRTVRSEAESKLAYARRAALAVVSQLKDTDMVGLIAFDSEPFEVSSLRPLRENRAQMEHDIPRLQPGGGTDFYDALDSARRQLIDSGVTTRHVMLLTDGDTNRGAGDHYPLISALAKAGISVTTIRIGDDAVNLTLLTDISSRTGGQFYHVLDVERLPELLLKDTSQALEHAPRRDEKFRPRLAGVSQALRGIKQSELPELDGYAYARAKTGADVLLYVAARDKKDPLLAAWQYGLGRVVSFTASPDDDAEGWVGWESFGKFWSQVVHWAVREQTPWDFTLDVHRVDGQTTLEVHSFEDSDDGLLLARLFTAADHPLDVTLVPQAPREYSARLPALPGGRYPLTITRVSGNREVAQQTEVVTVPDHDEEPQEEFESARPNLSSLHALTDPTGGAVDAPLRSLVGRKPGSRRMDYPLDWLLLPAAMLLFLADVGLRRLSVPGAMAAD